MNQAINFFWTIICFIPIIAFWTRDSLVYCFACMAIAVLSMLIPSRWLQLSINPTFYESIGVKFIRKFVQGGDWANRYTRKTNPGHKLIKDSANATQYMKTVLMYERYHFFSFVFFVLTAVFALVKDKAELAIIICFANIIYNICPILLQQYNRARLLKLKK